MKNERIQGNIESAQHSISHGMYKFAAEMLREAAKLAEEKGKRK